MSTTARIAIAATGLTFALPAQAQDAIGLPVPLTYSYNIDHDFSPDGTRMLFLSRHGDVFQMFVAGVDGSDRRRLLDDDARHADPDWSPDAQRVAFVREVDGISVVHMVNLDGSGLAAISDPGLHAIHPRWSPDGRAIVYNRYPEDQPPAGEGYRSGLYRYDLDTGVTVELAGADGDATYPSISPDGKRLLFRRKVDGNSDIWVANADGSEARRLTEHEAMDGWPEWSPDGRQIAFGSDRNGPTQIFVMRDDGSNVRLAANQDGRSTYPKWSPDGTMLSWTYCQRVGLKRACEIYSIEMPNKN